MRAYVRIVIEQQNADHWLAWFVDSPERAAGGQWAADALARLLLLFGPAEFETDEVSSVADAERPGRMELRIPLRRRLRLPRPSAN